MGKRVPGRFFRPGTGEQTTRDSLRQAIEAGLLFVFFQGLEPERIVVLHMAFWNIAREHGAEGWAFAWGQSGHVDVNGQEDGHDAGAAKMNKDAPLQNFPCEFSFKVQGFGATL